MRGRRGRPLAPLSADASSRSSRDPFAAVGVDDMLDVIIDQNTPIYGHLARLCERLRGVPTPPIVLGVGPRPIPRPERLYVWFGDPIDTTRLVAALTTRPPSERSATRSSRR